jgi:hypothetical protein
MLLEAPVVLAYDGTGAAMSDATMALQFLERSSEIAAEPVLASGPCDTDSLRVARNASKVPNAQLAF